MAISTARQNGKANATPASMVGASFSVPTPTVAANDNTRPKTRPGDETQILPNNAVTEGDSGSRGRNNVYPLRNATPEQRQEQEESLKIDQKKGLSIGEARTGLPSEIADSLEGINKETKAANDNEPVPETTSLNSTLNNNEPLEDDSQQFLTPDQIASINSENPNRNKYLAAMKELSKAGFKNINTGDIDAILKAGRKVPLPKGYIIISIFNFFTSIVFSLIGLTMTVVGLGAEAVGWASAIFTFGIGALVGSVVGKSVAVIGLGIWVMQIITNTALSIGSIISQIYYLKSASIILRKTAVLKKYALRLLTIRGITILLGWVPLFNCFIFLAGGRSFYRMAKREIHKAIDIVEKEFKQ